jgi:uncharacterized protein (TIGR03067 family)
MKRKALALVAAGLLLAGEPVTDAAREEMKKLEGTWEPVALESGGQRATPGELKEINGSEKLTIKDGKTAVCYGTKCYEAVVTVDPTKNPKTIDMVVTEGKLKGLTSLAIYDVHGDELKICYDVEQERVRPKEFTSKGTCVIVGYKRVKP